MTYNCPGCNNELQEVRYNHGSLLNEEQFTVVRAGDYYCTQCSGSRSNTGYRYYWKGKLENLLFGGTIGVES